MAEQVRPEGYPQQAQHRPQGEQSQQAPRPTRRMRARPLDEAAWAPFGWLPVADTDPRDGDHRLEFEWDDVHVNVIGHARSEVRAVAGGLRCEILYRHVSHTQAIMVLDHPAVIVVAPPGTDLGSPAGPAAIRAFLLAPHDAFVLHRGTWHWGPFPTHKESVQLFNIQGLRYRDDNESFDLRPGGQAIDLDLIGA